MRNAFFIIAAILVSNRVFAHESARVYSYKFEYSNAADLGFADELTGRIANALGKSAEKCVDLRSLGSSSNGQFQSQGTMGIMMNAPLSPKAIEDIKNAICKKPKDLDPIYMADPSYANALSAINKCKAKFSLKSAKLSEVELKFDAYDEGKMKSTSFALGDRTELPKFSEGCGTGKSADSWNNAASTQGAQLLISGTDGAAKFNVVGVKGGGLDWTFGFPNEDSFKAIESLSSTNIKSKERAEHTAISH